MKRYASDMFPDSHIRKRWLWGRRTSSIQPCITVIIVTVAFFASVSTWFLFLPSSYTFRNVGEPDGSTQRNENLHVLLPATEGNQHLCKVVLSSAVLGYNSPVFIGWGVQPTEGEKHGGSHALKISKTLEYLDSINPAQDNDLVILIDAYDVHVQLPPSVLIERYYRVNAEANARLKKELGAAYEKENIRQTIFFAAAKRYWPNPVHEVSTWTAPQSPAPIDTYGNDTDTIVGHTIYYSVRQRFMNSGFIIGPVGDMKKMFVRAQERIETAADYKDSDQSVFAIMMGEQNHARERLRLKHVSRWEKMRNPRTAMKPRGNLVSGVVIDNILNPSITHIPFEPKPNLNYEFGMGLDYMLDISHQTSSSEIERDSEWVTYRNASDRIEDLSTKRKQFDCKMRVKEDLPYDISGLHSGPYDVLDDDNSKGAVALKHKTWYDVSLYTHLCYGSIPVLIHHNGNKSNRDKRWRDVWLVNDAKMLLAAQQKRHNGAYSNDEDGWKRFRANPGINRAGGAWSDQGKWMEWEKICPDKLYDGDLFGSR